MRDVATIVDHLMTHIAPQLIDGQRGSASVWSVEEIIQMADNYMPKQGKRGPHKKRARKAITIHGRIK
jgi:hypothetical protein